MHVTTGLLKRQPLKFPKSKKVRPTQEKVRKAIFDVLGDFVASTSVLDLFSGSGALGIEAISNNARDVVFIEKNALCINTIKQNIKQLQLASKCRLIGKDVFVALGILHKQKAQFDLIFADAPYGKGLAKKCLLDICKYDILQPSAILVIEHYKKDELPSVCSALKLWQQKRYGDTFVSFYTLT